MAMSSEVDHAIPSTWAREVENLAVLGLMPHQDLFTLQLFTKG
jgi:hypothetical protein